ncbi:adenosine kinase [Nilaparvata lugens]|uniref:adenosine kinase n=1 Tax=Nilaparvata lugens TaxID=108931 RepID=UPI00193DE3C3|nr:adenosine kinase [Nilaparvata lugens]
MIVVIYLLNKIYSYLTSFHHVVNIPRMEEMLREGSVLCIGNPLLDISATVSDDFLEKWSLKPNDAILATEKHVALYKEFEANYSVEYTAGGASQNTARVAQWILKKPNICAYFGCVGRDDYSKILKEKAVADGVNVQYQYHETEPTGEPSVSNQSIISILNNASYYLQGFFLTVSVESILEVAQVAHKRNKLFLMNLSAPFLVQLYKSQMMQVLPYVDILFGNEYEALTFSKEHNFNTEDISEIALKLMALPKQNSEKGRIVVITQGKESVILAQDGKVKEFAVESLPSEKVIDTNGAGDAFVGGFIAQLVKGVDLSQCIKCGIWAASRVIERSGCTFDVTQSYDNGD